MTTPPSGMPRIAVVTAAYNMETYIGATIASVLEQTLSDFEMIAVDDGSRDGTAGIISAIDDPRVRLISTPNAGAGAARNRGLAACHAPLVVFLDGDDLLLPDALERMVATMAANPDHVACFGHHAKIDEDGTALGSTAPPLRPLPATDTLRHLLRKNIIVNGGALCIRTEAARRVGGYDASLRFAEDPRRARRFRSDQWRCRPDIFAAPALRERFTERERRRYRRLAEINTHWLAARNALTERRLGRFAQYLVAGATAVSG
jgi:glycosyltransferase involved in cell wall biosynthesis